MEDGTRIVFDYGTNVKLNYDEELSLKDIIPPDSNILIVSNHPYGCGAVSLSDYRSMMCCDISSFVKPYGSQYVGTALARSRERQLKGRKRFSYVRGNLDSFAKESFDWVIFDVEDVKNELEEASGEKLDEIFRDTFKVGRNVAYIRYVDASIEDGYEKLVLETVARNGINILEATEYVLRKGSIELQMDSRETGNVVSSFRKAGLKEVNILISPNVRKDPCVNLSGGLFIYATDL